MIKIVDYALLDGTFYQDGELSRDMSKIPHPFVKESMMLFKDLSKQNKQKEEDASTSSTSIEDLLNIKKKENN